MRGLYWVRIVFDTCRLSCCYSAALGGGRMMALRYCGKRPERKWQQIVVRENNEPTSVIFS